MAPERNENDRGLPAPRFITFFTGPWTWQNLWSWGKLILLILFLKWAIIDQYTIPSGSMEPTLHGDPGFFQGDRVLVNKWLYGPRLPFTTVRLWEWSKPERWDIVVFHAVEPDSEHTTLIKRVAGLPGETVGFHDGHLTVDGEIVPFPESMQANEIRYYGPAGALVRYHHAQSEAERHYWQGYLKQLKYGCREGEEFQKIPEGHYFMLGDNSAQSYDGRMYGWVPHNHLFGQAFAVWWPWSHRKDFTGFTGTWWGQGLLYGIPIGIVLLEVLNYLRHRRREEAEAESEES